MVLKNGLSRMRGDPHVRFLGGGGAAMRRCYPTRFTMSMRTVGLVRRQLRRSQLLAFFEKRPRYLIGMEACAGSHD